jgi:hypothetical protein
VLRDDGHFANHVRHSHEPYDQLQVWHHHKHINENNYYGNINENDYYGNID